MATRTIYSCDWCGVDSPHIGSVDEDWEKTDDKGKGPLWLCGACASARSRAIEVERQKRFHLRNSGTPGGAATESSGAAKETP